MAASGHRQSNPSYALAWTVGETAVRLHLAGAKSLGEGFHRASICPTLVSVPEAPFPNSADCVGVVENPFGDRLRLRADCPEFDRCAYSLRDIHGRTVRSGIFDLDQRDLSIGTADLAEGIYLLTLDQPAHTFHQQFKLVKTL